MSRQSLLIALLLLVLAACRQSPTPGLPTAAPPTTVATASPTAAPTGQIFIPIAPGGEATPPPAEAAYPAATGMPGPPTATPEPEYPVYTGPPLNRGRWAATRLVTIGSM